MTLPATDRRHRRRRLHRLEPRASACSTRAARSSASTTSRWAARATSTGCSATRASRFHEFDCRDARALRRAFAGCDAIVAPRGREDPPLRRGARARSRATSTARTPPATSRSRSTCRSCSTSTSDVYGNAEPAVRRGRPDRARPADDAGAGPTRRRSSSTSTSRSRMRRGARPEVHDPALFNAYGPRNHPTLVGRPAVGVHRGPARRRDDGAPRRRPPGALVHLRDRHGRRLRARARHAGGVRRGHQHRRRRADHDRRARRSGAGGDRHRGPAAREASCRYEKHRRPLPGRALPRPVDREGRSASSASRRTVGPRRRALRVDARLAPHAARGARSRRRVGAA